LFCIIGLPTPTFVVIIGLSTFVVIIGLPTSKFVAVIRFVKSAFSENAVGAIMLGAVSIPEVMLGAVSVPEVMLGAAIIVGLLNCVA
jgi:hypothetical protein